MNGIVPLYKERGMTSNDCVFKCRRIFKTKRVGHSGTLDPNVDGVLPICIGKATKVVNYLMDSGKIYIGEITLGFATTTEDLEGDVIAERKLTKPFETDVINEAMQSLTGELIQIPPMYSAIKVRGRRLYDYARAGETVERPRRKIIVNYFKQINNSTFKTEKGQQKIQFEVGCGKGTYVRTLAVDLGKRLGVPAVMSDLTRLASGGFTISQAVKLDDLKEAVEKGELEGQLFPADHALKKYPHYTLTDTQWGIVKNGGFLSPKYLGGENRPTIVLMYTNQARALYCFNQEKERYQPEQMIDLTEGEN
ncbi:tRNA pseudouridine synthase B [Liquorilactobacillus aquaticus DSM 21051]|uniref:tRNA pseudouridine synthase B n=1 Tax=Liquorilactobacillus aquaticus DSM 21051 TaxID=1423725 RepID=A0A0R2D394_9LACO|nr:tRNA pseudouridine(55) synthase TruB [Liquorilactobacillus aquaticus]KRM96404.1 tRNA pseudouridine synthase B [Liquorilactobacillus aquaticus DSM 21051]